MNDRDRIITEALSWLNTPYHHEGDVKGVGVDCAMFPTRVYVDLELVPWFDPRPYPMNWHLHRDDERYIANLKKHSHEVQSPGIGDLVMFRFGRSASHSGIVYKLDPLTFIHSFNGRGVIITEIHEEDFAARLDSFWSIFP